LSRTFVIDMANRSLLSDFLPMQSLRAAGLHLIGSIGPLRRLAMREALAPSWRPTRRASVLSLTFESQLVANMIHLRHGKRPDCT
jgi:2-octaprenyl-6-methoxyphenol hydroxylase